MYMATNQIIKKNQSSFHLLKTLKILLEDNYTVSEIVDRLNEEETEPIYNNNVVRKYINTCKYCGIIIQKKQGKLEVIKLPFGIHFNENDINSIETLNNYAKTCFSAKLYEKFKNLINKISKYSNLNTKNNYEIINKKNIEDFEKAIESQRKVELIFDARTVLTCTPLEIIQHAGKTFFNIADENGEKLYCSDKIVSINILQDRISYKKEEITVIFKLRGGLAKRYTPREHETVEICTESNTILITNKGENKEILFARLLRYDSCCEIISPKSYRNEMRDLLKNMLSNYGV